MGLEGRHSPPAFTRGLLEHRDRQLQTCDRARSKQEEGPKQGSLWFGYRLGSRSFMDFQIQVRASLTMRSLDNR